jgi:hypothetical protein
MKIVYGFFSKLILASTSFSPALLSKGFPFFFKEFVA